ncbi:hypothetical protein [Clostridium autoethanogenum]|nr:hypothetical protein [Clostridium autoethanogenum]
MISYKQLSFTNILSITMETYSHVTNKLKQDSVDRFKVIISSTK